MPKAGDNWDCPYCGKSQAIVDSRYSASFEHVRNDDGVLGGTTLTFESIVCANSACGQMTLIAQLWGRSTAPHIHPPKFTSAIKIWNLLPESTARPLPGYIPAALAQDYTEACRIRDLSPKASATLARRCLQGMIRDFCKVPKQRSLWHEIEVLKKLVDAGTAPRGVQADSMDAIHAVREVGNVGAHMEADINLLVDVDPGEAQALIELIELLFDEWYIEHEKRRIQLKKISAAAERVKLQKQEEPPAQ